MRSKSSPAIDAAASTFSSDRPDAEWAPMGSLKALHVRVGKEAAPRRVSTARAIAGFGIEDDKHASPRSPRQLLLAGTTAYERWNMPPTSLRENLLVDVSTERLHSGDLVRVGSDAILWLTFHCEPCSLLERRCPGTLKTIGAHRGMLARVVQGGTVHEGDAIALCRSGAPVFSDDWRERVLHVARAVPEGFWIGYRQLAELAGVPTAYCRAFPRVLARLDATTANRVVGEADMAGRRAWSGAELFAVQIGSPGAPGLRRC